MPQTQALAAAATAYHDITVVDANIQGAGASRGDEHVPDPDPLGAVLRAVRDNSAQVVTRDVAVVLGVSHQRVSQIEKAATAG